MINWLKCFFGFHDYSTWKEHEGTAGLGSYRYRTRFCKACDYEEGRKGLG